MTQPNTGPDTSKDAEKDTSTNADPKAGSEKDGVKDDGKSNGKNDDDLSGLKKALAAERKQREALEKAARDAELAKLPELERYQKENLALVDENTKLKTENMQRATAMKLGLPWAIGKRLTGETPEEMEADGLELAKSYKVDDKKLIDDKDKDNKKLPNDAKRNGGTGKPDMNAILRALR
jgi:hypothetical protein